MYIAHGQYWQIDITAVWGLLTIDECSLSILYQKQLHILGSKT